MFAFRCLLFAILAVVCGYTVVVINNHGLELLSIFFGDIAKLGWPGQFNVDFTGFLLLSGFWLAWRHHFSPPGLALGLLGLFGGSPVLVTYLLIASFAADGNVEELLLGRVRARS